jgi:CheY-like chemotaxis protein
VVRGHFLVVDDEAIVRESCRMILGHLGCTCETVGSAAEAVKLVGDRRFDGAIVDLHLGGINHGREVLEQIRRHRPELLGRTVLTSGDATAPATLDLAGRFRLRILPKPFGVRELRAVLGAA